MPKRLINYWWPTWTVVPLRPWYLLNQDGLAFRPTGDSHPQHFETAEDAVRYATRHRLELSLGAVNLCEPVEEPAAR